MHLIVTAGPMTLLVVAACLIAYNLGDLFVQVAATIHGGVGWFRKQGISKCKLYGNSGGG